MDEPRAPFKVIIIGAGLAGSLLANGLIHNNVHVCVYERLPRHAEREGYQIRLGAPALKGMRACLTEQQINKVVERFGRSGGLRSGAPVIYNSNFKPLLDLTVFPVYSKSAPIRRGLLRDLLADPVFDHGNMHYGCAFTRYEIIDPTSPTERVRVWFDNGTVDECDILIGADGSHSKVNQQLGLNNISQITSHIGMISKNDLPTSSYMKMTSVLAQKPALTFADKKAMFFSAYLPDKMAGGGDAPKCSFDESMSSMMFGVQIPVEVCPPDLFEFGNDEKWNFVDSVFKTWSKEHHEVMDLVRGSDLYVYKGRASSKPSSNWRQKMASTEAPELGHPRVWLLGDAMHVMLPLRGMGGNQSLCDTATALPLLVNLSSAAVTGRRPTSQEVLAACKSYEDKMIPRAPR